MADDLIKTSSDFHTEDETVAARQIVDGYLAQRLTKRKGPDKARASGRYC